MPATELRICENCNKTVIGLCFCNYVFGTPPKYDLVLQQDIKIIKFHALWNLIHDQENATPWWFKTWVEKIPQNDCGCPIWLLKYIVTNPPRYDDWYNWTVELHNAVNIKLGKPIWPHQV